MHYFTKYAAKHFLCLLKRKQNNKFNSRQVFNKNNYESIHAMLTSFSVIISKFVRAKFITPCKC